MLEKFVDGLKYSFKQDRNIFRRYLILGAFDGLLLVISIVTTALLAHISEKTANLTTISSLLSISIASIANTLIVEIKEKQLEFKNLEKQMMRSLKGTIYDYGMKISIVLSALFHGLSPFLGLIILFTFNYTKNFFMIVLSSSLILFSLGLFYEGDLKEKIKTSIFIVVSGVILMLIIALLSS